MKEMTQNKKLRAQSPCFPISVEKYDKSLLHTNEGRVAKVKLILSKRPRNGIKNIRLLKTSYLLLGIDTSFGEMTRVFSSEDIISFRKHDMPHATKDVQAP